MRTSATSEDDLGRLAAAVGPRRVVVVSDRYPPDVAGGAEVSLHLLLREPPLRDRCMVVTFDKSLERPLRRSLDGVEVLALPASAAWPLHRLSQQEVERLKRLPFGLKWAAFMRETLSGLLRAPRTHGPAVALQLLGPPPGGVRMEQAATLEGRAAGDLRTIFDAVLPAVVHADNATAIVAAAEALGDGAAPLVAVVRDHRFTSLWLDQTDAPPEPGLRGWLAAHCARAALAYRRQGVGRAAAVVATSDHMAGALDGLVPPRTLRRLPLEPVALPSRTDRGGGEAFSILVAGSLTDNKGQAHLVEAWPQLVARIPQARLDLAGQGPGRAEIEALVERVGAGDRIRLHGHVEGEALAALYRDCDVVALPTLWDEPFGRVPLEAGAARRPVVAYAAGGHLETIADGVTGRLVARGDRAAFVEALGDLAADPELRARMGEAGRARAAERYDPQRLADMLAALWDDVAARGEPEASLAPRRVSSGGG